MAQDLLHRPLAVAFARVPTQIRGRLLSMLPEALQGGIRDMIAGVDALSEDDLTPVERSLVQDVDALFGDEDSQSSALPSDALPIRLSDILALILSVGSVPEVADLVRRLPAEVESETLHLIAAQGWDALVRRSDYDTLTLLSELGDALGVAERQANPTFAAEVLRHIQSPSVIRRILTAMYDKDPDSATQVQDLLYGFGDLVKLSDRELQTVLQGVDHWDLILALRPAPTGLRRKVLANLSARRAALVRDDEKVLDEVDDAQIGMLQHQIMDRTRLLYETGAIRTYMGSIERDEPLDAEGAAPVSAPPTQSLPPKATPKKKSGRNYVIGLLVGVGTIAVAVFALMWFSQAKQRTQSVDASRGAMVEDSQAADSTETDAAIQRRRRSLERAAVITGQALLMSGDRIQPLSKDTVQPGDRVTTGKDGQASVQLEDGAGQLQIERDTDVEVVDSDDARAEAPRLQVRVGNLWVQVKDPSLEVVTPVADISGAEGSVFHLSIALNASTTVTVHAGTVWVRPRSDSQTESVVLSAGERVRLMPDGSFRRSLHNDPMDMQTP